jgi:hypothetical protein
LLTSWALGILGGFAVLGLIACLDQWLRWRRKLRHYRLHSTPIPPGLTGIGRFQDFLGTHQPGFAREVGVPVLTLLGLWLLAWAAAMLWAFGLERGQGPLEAVLLAGLVLLPLAFLLLFLRWAWRTRA